MTTRSSFGVQCAGFAITGLAFAVLSAYAADSAPSSAAPASKVVSFEPIAGSTLKRITLSAKAAERLDIQTGKVSQEVVVRKQTVSGMVIYPQQAAAANGAPQAPAGASGLGSSGGFGGGAVKPIAADAAMPIKLVPVKAVAALETVAGATAAQATKGSGQSVVLVNLSQGEFNRIAKDKPARISPLYTRDKDMKEMTALLSDAAPVEDARRSMLGLHYLLPNSDHGLAPSTRVRVELQLADKEGAQKTVPYSAVYYDTKGTPWVYVNSKPLTYERQRIAVHRVVGNVAVLSEGPEVGTAVVTVGAALLYGTEIYGK